MNRTDESSQRLCLLSRFGVHIHTEVHCSSRLNAETCRLIARNSLIRSGAAMPFTAHATPPTITMPRVKAMTTGSIPSFLDVILNFAESDTTSTLAQQDTWLAQLKAQPGGELVMYGDDTWLKLFPDTFSRADGTSSFFVSVSECIGSSRCTLDVMQLRFVSQDYTEVDDNVTRHVAAELRRTDWNGMILHYLGLDHIGHKSGPRRYMTRHSAAGRRY